MVVAPLTVTVAAPLAPKSPLWETPTLTVIGLAGAGLAVMVKVAAPPSMIPPAAVMVSSGVSLSDTATVAASGEPIV